MTTQDDIVSSEDTASGASYASPLAASNPYRGYQYYLDGEANGASDGVGANVDAISLEYTGRGVVVGIIDEGFDTANPDLAGRFDLSRSFDPRDVGISNVMPDSSSALHGTWVAGVLGASADNGFGIVGVAPEATLVGFYARYGMGGSARGELAGLLARQVNVDISNNSWGYTLEFNDNFHDPAWSQVAGALHSGVSDGRGGLGTIFVFAAGNDRQYVENSLSYDGDNTNYHSLTNNRFTITVASTTESGHVSPFSTSGTSILVSAPGDTIITTAVDDGDGNRADDFSFVSGTSFSAPIVSGVVAMMLEANPELGYRDVQEILALSAHKIDAGAASWSENGATNWNGGANLVSNDFGFGLVDAHAAVRLAETWTTAHTIDNESVISVAGAVGSDTALVDFQPLSYTVTVPGSFAHFSINWVEVDVTLLHTYIGDLQIDLISPTGTDSLLMDRPGAGTNTHDNLNFTFSTTHDWGESPVGTWTLIVEDAGTGGTGSMVSFALRIYGDKQGGGDTYYYTDDFATLSGDRGTISDGAGNDTINAAAVTSGMVLDLHSGAVSTIAGRAVTISATTVIENAYGGDGNDTIVGNDAGDHLHGGHGNDAITGGSGDDVIDGGAGADRMAGGAGNDTYLVDNPGDVVIEHSGDGIDTVVTGFDHVLADNVENVTLTGTADISATGNGLDNVIVSNSGVDILAGGDGNDTYYVHNALDHVIETAGGGNDIVYADVDFTLPTNVETLILIAPDGSQDASGVLSLAVAPSTAAMAGAVVPDFVRIDGYGNDLDNTMIGNVAGNLLNGGHGADAMFGGAGDDIYVVDNIGDVVSEFWNDGNDTVYADVDYALGANVENLILWGSGSLHASGNALDNIIFANAAGDNLDGGTGNDAIVGGAGSDVIAGGDGSDWLYGGAGNDVISGGAGNNILAGADGDDTLMGGSGSNWLEGDAGNDVLTGGAGNDVLLGGDGDDLLNGGDGDNGMLGGAGNDTLIGGTGNDWIGGGEGADILVGGAGTDVLAGDEGNDRLTGGAGRDFLVGGAGADAFVFTGPADGGDFIWDFERGVDAIEISRAGFGLPASGADVTFAEGNGMPVHFDTDGPVAYVDDASHTLMFDPTGGSSADAVLIAGFISGIPGASDLHFV